MIDWTKRKVWTAEQIKHEQLVNGTPVNWELDRRSWARRQIAAVAFGIELRDISTMFANDYDRIAETINPREGTCDPILDEFFLRHFTPMTTSWIHHHPMLDEVAETFDRYQTMMRGMASVTVPKYAHLLKQRV